MSPEDTSKCYPLDRPSSSLIGLLSFQFFRPALRSGYVPCHESNLTQQRNEPRHNQIALHRVNLLQSRKDEADVVVIQEHRF
jgi:hypothetical protein